MKVCLINNLYGKNAVGGAETVVSRRALLCKEQGNEVCIITTKASKSPKIEKNNENGIDIYRVYIPNIFYYKDLGKHGFFLKLIWHFIDIFNSPKVIKQVLKEEKPDVVETHNLMGINFKVIRNKEKGIKKYKWTHYLHDVQLVEPSGVLIWNHKNDNVLQKIYSWIVKSKFRDVDEVVSPSEFLKKFYEERGFFNSSEFIVHSLEFNKIQIKACNNKFLYVGSLVDHKGIRVLMNVWDRVVGDKELHIVGDGILRDEVEKWVSDKPNVKVHGRLEGEDLENIYNECDTLIFPSICIENNPTVIHEAHAHGLRVIASDTGGVREIVGENDVLVEPGNVKEMMKHLNT